MGLTEENWPENSRRPVQECVKFPKPQGVIWDKMVEQYWHGRGFNIQAMEVSAISLKELDTELVRQEAAMVQWWFTWDTK